MPVERAMKESAGVLVADKPAGWTSHDVVARVKKRLGAKKVGHLGTLDPLATGVLPLVVNRATKFARLLQGGLKVYEAVMLLGVETDSYDSEGKVTATGKTDGIDRAAIEGALLGLKGKISQIPPMYSAVKKNGVPLYKLARKGVVVARSPREIEVFELEITGLDLPRVAVRVVCTRGTYVRTLVHDAGRALGCGAHLVELRRTGSGPFMIEGAVSPESTAHELQSSMIPLETALKLAGVEDTREMTG